MLSRTTSGALAAVTLIVAHAEAANAQQYDRKNFNWNATACPQSTMGLPTVQVDKFKDGSPLPSCGTTAHGHPVKLVWTGHGWATYGPSVQATPAPSAPPRMDLAPHAADFRVDSSALPGYRKGVAPAVGSKVMYQGKQYQVTQVISQGGGNVLTNNGGTLVNTNGSNLLVTLKLITSDGAGMQQHR